MLDYFRKRPMLIAAVGCSVISVCGYYSVKALFFAAAVFSVFLSVAVAKRNTACTVAVLLILLTAVSCFTMSGRIRNLNNFSSSKISAEIVVCENTYKSEQIYRSEVEILNCDKLSRGTKLALWHKPSVIQNGQIIKAEIRLGKIEDEYRAQSYSNGIFLSGSITEMEATDRKDPVISTVEGVRKYIKNTLFGNMDYDAAATMCALVFGDRSYFTNEFYYNVKASGVAHVMVVSGMHLSILVSLFLKLIERFIYNPVLRALMMFAVVIMLCALCGFTMSVLRAGVTFVIMAFGLLINKPYSGENALGAAVAFIMIFSPFAIFNVAFQLSVLSTFGILAVALPGCKYIESRKLLTNKIVLSIVQSAVISLSALILTLPVTIYVFGYISTVSVITNLLISSAVTWCLCLTVAALIIRFILPAPARLIFCFAELIVKYVNGVINYFGSRKYSVLEIPKTGAYISVAAIAAVFWFLLACKKRIDMLKLKRMKEKIKEERGRRQKWQSFMRTH